MLSPFPPRLLQRRPDSPFQRAAIPVPPPAVLRPDPTDEMGEEDVEQLVTDAELFCVHRREVHRG